MKMQKFSKKDYQAINYILDSVKKEERERIEKIIGKLYRKRKIMSLDWNGSHFRQAYEEVLKEIED